MFEIFKKTPKLPKTSRLGAAQDLEASTVINGQREKKTAQLNPGLLFTPHGSAQPEELHRYDQAVFSWTAPEYIQHQKSPTWYAIAGGILVLFILGSLFTQNWTLAAAVIVFAFVYTYLQAKQPPKQIRITISKLGIKVGNMIFPYTHVQAFWIYYHPPGLKTLNLRVHQQFFSDVVIQLDDQDPAPIREFLCGQISEWEGKTERLSEVILRLLKL